MRSIGAVFVAISLAAAVPTGAQLENHSFTQATSWADEYKRIPKLLENRVRGRNGTATD